ncbi:hypothetical protein EPD60_03610 [Flaviaesturariibacter flavus]|uniref:DUF4412 domain-containing protein n=1 Tax=Flaviaesturariibacter flavus TaxID=2502780 RepID=A0A4R1BME7_9BACT|nr:DUF6263 family protein [Flaviaesturariibacter flavus]TCJ18599.1 hypothetical protein EPD60_03610 [Flaviaesturariibacter flavus]
MKKALLFGALALSLNGFAQKVNGKLNLSKGQKFEVVSETKTNATQEVMGQSMEVSSNSTFTQVYDVQDAGANGITIEHKVKRFEVMSEGGPGQSMSYDSENEADRKGEMGRMIDKKVLKNKYTMMVDAFGKVTSVKPDDDNPNGKKGAEDDGMAAMMMQQMGAGGSTLPKAGDKSFFSVLPSDKEVGVGETWTDAVKKDGADNKRTYKITAISAEGITVEYTSETKINKEMAMMGQNAQIDMTEKGSGTVIVDRKTGVVRTLTGVSKTEGNVEVQGMTIPVTSTTNTTVTVKAL